MKAPRADWQSWRNVLLPGQSTTVTQPASRQGRGVSVLDTVLTYFTIDGSQPAGVRKVVSKQAADNEVQGGLLPNGADDYVFEVENRA